MISYLSQNGMNKVFEQIVTADPNLMQYGFGQIYNQNGEIKAAQRYPGLWVTPVKTDITAKQYTINRTYQILIYDITDAVKSNENSVISDCEEIAFRICRFLRDRSEVFTIIGQPVITPFSDKFLDDVCGVTIDIQIEFNGESSDCEDPVYNFNIKYNDLD